MSSGYRLAPAVGARLLGVLLVLVALVVLALTVLAAALGWPTTVLPAAAGAGLVVVAGAAWVLLRGVAVVTLDDDGYRVRLVRGAGVSRAGWREVEDAVTAEVRASPCVVLRLKDGRTTTIPVAVLAADRDAFVTDLREHLRRAEGLRPL